MTFILGLCGSGKTHLADEMADERGLIKFDEGFAVEPHQRRELLEALRAGRDCVVVEVGFMFADQRHILIEWLMNSVPGVKIEWLAFENDLETANWNCCRRKNKGDGFGHVGLNLRWSPGYTIPDGAKVIEIHRLPED